MKNLLLLCVLLLSTGLFAQSGYEKAMAAGLQQIKDAKTSNEMSSASAYFERIANSEKTNWLPYYYAALTNNLAGWMDETADKDKVSAKTNELIAQADALSKDNSEIYCFIIKLFGFNLKLPLLWGLFLYALVYVFIYRVFYFMLICLYLMSLRKLHKFR